MSARPHRASQSPAPPVAPRPPGRAELRPVARGWGPLFPAGGRRGGTRAASCADGGYAARPHALLPAPCSPAAGSPSRTRTRTLCSATSEGLASGQRSRGSRAHDDRPPSSPGCWATWAGRDWRNTEGGSGARRGTASRVEGAAAGGCGDPAGFRAEPPRPLWRRFCDKARRKTPRRLFPPGSSSSQSRSSEP